jgi:hypothetical protein
MLAGGHGQVIAAALAVLGLVQAERWADLAPADAFLAGLLDVVAGDVAGVCSRMSAAWMAVIGSA